jgi:hypothetical protein
VRTARGPVEVVRQEMRGLRRGRGWTWFWLARRAGNVDWHAAPTPAEAIRRAVLLPARKPPAWLREAAATAEGKLLTDGLPDTNRATDGDPPAALPDELDAP